MARKNAQQLAAEIAAKYNPDKLAPFPYENILETHDDLSIVHTSLDDEKISGVILLKDDTYFILINTLKHTNRQNFTLGHELGHYFLHKHLLKENNDSLVDSDEYIENNSALYSLDEAERDVVEREANQFASALLMPEALVRDAWSATNNIVRLAEIFKVSVVAVSKRLTELRLVD